MKRSYQAIQSSILQKNIYKDDNGCILQVDNRQDVIWGVNPHGLVTFMTDLLKLESAYHSSDIRQFLEFWDVPRDDIGQLIYVIDKVSLSSM